jgi:hypothetical protein
MAKPPHGQKGFDKGGVLFHSGDGDVNFNRVEELPKARSWMWIAPPMIDWRRLDGAVMLLCALGTTNRHYRSWLNLAVLARSDPPPLSECRTPNRSQPRFRLTRHSPLRLRASSPQVYTARCCVDIASSLPSTFNEGGVVAAQQTALTLQARNPRTRLCPMPRRSVPPSAVVCSVRLKARFVFPERPPDETPAIR